MDPNLINTVITSEPMLALPVAIDSSTSTGSETTSEVIARLEQKIVELSHIVTQTKSASQTPPNVTPNPDARQKGPMLPSFSNPEEFDQGDPFTTSQQFQSTHPTQSVPFVYTFAPPKAQNISLAHDSPPVYTCATVPPMTQTQQLCRLDANQYVEMENDTRIVNDDIVNRKLKSLEDAMRSLHGLGSSQSVRYEELCAFPEIELPPGYKIPKFEKFDGSGNPLFHLKVYCEKLIGVGKNEGIRIKLFNQSLSGKALEWYSKQDPTKWRTWDDLANAFVDHYKFHIEIAPDRISITKLKPKSTESFREYAIRWREEASRVHPPMDEVEMITYFIQAQDSDYYERMVTMGGKTFAEVIKAGEMIEDGLKTGRITSLTALQSANKVIQTGNFGNRKKKEKDVMGVMTQGSVSNHPNPPQNLSNAQYAQYSPHPHYPTSAYPVFSAQPTYRSPQPAQNYHQVPPPTHQNEYNHPRPNYERKPPRVFTPLAESMTQLYERLKATGILHPVEAKPVNTSANWYDPDKRCLYHSGVVGHDTEKCITLKHKIQDLIDKRVISLAEAPANVTTNPLPNHKK